MNRDFCDWTLFNVILQLSPLLPFFWRGRGEDFVNVIVNLWTLRYTPSGAYIKINK